ncbi:hypothetical protein FSP39_003090 [Pinctada imbricata]|uniref:Fibrinogen C-terminal domain-containing protein n=1 Tax=Pinctada imbricata TaxID=66713 RepID=A0AA89BQ84_PINIB|nr:hypothetical protein FSP39_003090 [Pinctada imbricata]
MFIVGKFPNTKPKSCSQVIPRKQDSNKTYTIYPDGRTGISVYCDMNTDGGGWTVIQQRFNGELNFNRNWKDYKEGFGVALHNKEYWLGNEYLHILTMKGNCTLRVDVVTRKGDPGYALYQNFSVGPESEAYKLRIGKYSGTAGESGWSGLTHQNGMGFSTPDRDNDLYKNNCASDYKAGFWYKACFNVNLNTPYGGSAFIWYQWKKSGKREYLKRSKMMLRC